MTSCDIPEDYVVATGELHSVKEVIDIAHQTSEISTPLSDILVTSDDFLRKKDHSNLHGSSEKIYHALGWEPSYSFENRVQQIQLMVLKNYQRSGLGS
jgi:GDPmannose 4,6-dehydratase